MCVCVCVYVRGRPWRLLSWSVSEAVLGRARCVGGRCKEPWVLTKPSQILSSSEVPAWEIHCSIRWTSLLLQRREASHWPFPHPEPEELYETQEVPGPNTRRGLLRTGWPAGARWKRMQKILFAALRGAQESQNQGSDTWEREHKRILHVGVRTSMVEKQCVTV